MNAKQFRMEQMKALARANKKLDDDRKRMTKEHSERLKKDIVEIYSAMAIVMFKNGNSIDEIQEIVGQIQQEWFYHVRHKQERSGQTIAEYCEELTGIKFDEQVE